VDSLRNENSDLNIEKSQRFHEFNPQRSDSNHGISQDESGKNARLSGKSAFAPRFDGFCAIPLALAG
jgi:hypothetical protein